MVKYHIPKELISFCVMYICLAKLNDNDTYSDFQ